MPMEFMDALADLKKNRKLFKTVKFSNFVIYQYKFISWANKLLFVILVLNGNYPDVYPRHLNSSHSLLVYWKF